MYKHFLPNIHNYITSKKAKVAAIGDNVQAYMSFNTYSLKVVFTQMKTAKRRHVLFNYKNISCQIFESYNIFMSLATLFQLIFLKMNNNINEIMATMYK